MIFLVNYSIFVPVLPVFFFHPSFTLGLRVPLHDFTARTQPAPRASRGDKACLLHAILTWPEPRTADCELSAWSSGEGTQKLLFGEEKRKDEVVLTVGTAQEGSVTR